MVLVGRPSSATWRPCGTAWSIRRVARTSPSAAAPESEVVLLDKGAENGTFPPGVLVVMLFPKDALLRLNWAPGGPVRMGEPMARAKSSAPPMVRRFSPMHRDGGSGPQPPGRSAAHLSVTMLKESCARTAAAFRPGARRRANWHGGSWGLDAVQQRASETDHAQPSDPSGPFRSSLRQRTVPDTPVREGGPPDERPAAGAPPWSDAASSQRAPPSGVLAAGYAAVGARIDTTSDATGDRHSATPCISCTERRAPRTIVDANRRPLGVVTARDAGRNPDDAHLRRRAGAARKIDHPGRRPCSRPPAPGGASAAIVLNAARRAVEAYPPDRLRDGLVRGLRPLSWGRKRGGRWDAARPERSRSRSTHHAHRLPDRLSPPQPPRQKGSSSAAASHNSPRVRMPDADQRFGALLGGLAAKLRDAVLSHVVG